jgi:hypothetical protein
MADEIVFRNRRSEDRSPQSLPSESSRARDILDRPGPAAANDNDVTWPLIPFPDGWFGA